MALSTSVSLTGSTETEYFSFLIDYATRHNFSVALWRLPSDDKIQLVISKKPTVLKYTETLEDLPSGFVFAPFEPSAERIFLKADLAFSFSNGQLNAPTTSVEHASNVWLNDVMKQEDAAVNNRQIIEHCERAI